MNYSILNIKEPLGKMANETKALEPLDNTAVAGALFGLKQIGRTQMFAYASIKGSALRNIWRIPITV